MNYCIDDALLYDIWPSRVKLNDVLKVLLYGHAPLHQVVEIT